MNKCKKCGKELICIFCQNKKAGKKSAKIRFEGKNKKEISEIMKKVRRAKK